MCGMKQKRFAVQLNARMAGAVLALALVSAAGAAPNALPALRDIRLDGYVGGRLRSCFENHVVKTDGVYLTDPYRWRTEKVYWQTEFWGKYMHAAAPFARMTGDPRLAANIEAAVANLLPSQLPDGYLGNYCEESRCGRGWDVWGCKYTMLGLLFHYDLTGSKASLDAAARLCDYLRGVFGPGKKDIVLSGQYKGMPSCSVLEPVVWLYKRTKRPEHLAFAKYIVSQLDEHPDGPHLIRDAGVPVAARTADAKPGYEGQNPGLKAYEMMSCYQGLLEYYEATGDRRCLDAAVKTAESIVATEVNICGGSTCVEHWYTGALRQNRPYMRQQETCVLTTWMRLCEKLLTLTGESRWADELEKTFYNAYLGALHPNGSKFTTYSPLCGFRSFGQYHCKMHTNCCNANGPRGFVAVLNAFLQARGKDVFMNFFCSGKTSIALPDTGAKVTFETFTLYPERGTVEVWNRTEKPTEFTLNLRIPAWSEKTSVKLNGKPVADVKSGGYLSLARTWKMGDALVIDFDMTCRAHELDDYVAFTTGPIALARDMRFHDGDIGEFVRIKEFKPNGPVPGAQPVRVLSESMWMNWALPLPMGAHRESMEKRLPDVVHFCDYASAGNTWDSSSSYRVWLPLECFKPRQPHFSLATP